MGTGQRLDHGVVDACLRQGPRVCAIRRDDELSAPALPVCQRHSDGERACIVEERALGHQAASCRSPTDCSSPRSLVIKYQLQHRYMQIEGMAAAARREDEVHGMGLGMLGRGMKRAREGGFAAQSLTIKG
jgi:hypothetical protein